MNDILAILEFDEQKKNSSESKNIEKKNIKKLGHVINVYILLCVQWSYTIFITRVYV